jgi:hypothetical protein
VSLAFVVVSGTAVAGTEPCELPRFESPPHSRREFNVHFTPVSCICDADYGTRVA